MQLDFDVNITLGTGFYPDFIQYPKSEGQLFFLEDGKIFAKTSSRLGGYFDNPNWFETKDVCPIGDSDISTLELMSLPGFGIIGCYKTPTEQKLIIYEYQLDVSKYFDAASIKHSIDTPVSSFDITLQNPKSTSPEHEGNVGISETGKSLLSPGSKLTLTLTVGDSEEYALGTFFLDRGQFTLLAETVKADGRNLIGKALHDQTFDEDNEYLFSRIDELLMEILLNSNLTPDDVLIQPTTEQAGYKFSHNMTVLEGIDEVLKAIDNWQIKERVDGVIVIGAQSFLGFEKTSRYTFKRGEDIFSRSIARDDQGSYRRVCVHTQDFSLKVFKDVKAYSGWDIKEKKTLYVRVADGTSFSDANRFCTQLALRLELVGKIESFTGPIRPQLVVGDEARIIDDTGQHTLGLITEITHRLGLDGFYTDFTVDSGGRLGRGRISDYIGKITRDKTISSRVYE